MKQVLLSRLCELNGFTNAIVRYTINCNKKKSIDSTEQKRKKTMIASH